MTNERERHYKRRVTVLGTVICAAVLTALAVCTYMALPTYRLTPRTAGWRHIPALNAMGGENVPVNFALVPGEAISFGTDDGVVLEVEPSGPRFVVYAIACLESEADAQAHADAFEAGVVARNKRPPDEDVRIPTEHLGARVYQARRLIYHRSQPDGARYDTVYEVCVVDRFVVTSEGTTKAPATAADVPTNRWISERVRAWLKLASTVPENP